MILLAPLEYHRFTDVGCRVPSGVGTAGLLGGSRGGVGVVFQKQFMKLPGEGCHRSGSQGTAAWPAGGTSRAHTGGEPA